MRLAVLAVAAAAAIAAAPAAAQESYTAVPKPLSCNDNDRPETGLQGQVPYTERAQIFKGFSCNLEPVGQWEGEGASWQLASYDHCAYYSQADRVVTTGNPEDQTNPPKPGFEHPGTVVVDVSDPKQPKASAWLNDKGTNDAWESIDTNPHRDLLASAEEAGTGFSIYDISDDCAKPKVIADVDVEGNGHAGGFSPDGRTYWTGQTLRAIDISDPSKPKTIYPDITAEFPTHDVGISEDGNRVYTTVFGTSGGATNGLRILDVTEINQRKPEPKIKVLGEVFWTNGQVAQNALPVTIGGRPYIVFTDENGSNPLGQPATTAISCSQGVPPFGMARIIDIADETKPAIVSTLPLEVTLPENCPLVAADTAGEAFFGYDSHYCSVDDPEDARLLACSYLQSGLRVFDITDPVKPREIAYYNPPMKPGYKPGSNYSFVGVGSTRSADWTPAHPQFRLERREIWFTSQMNGFQVVRFRDNVELPVRAPKALSSAPGGKPAPAARPVSRLSLAAKARKSTVLATGRIKLPSGVSRAQGCMGRVKVSVLRGRQLVSRRTVWVSRSCRFSASLRGKRLRGATVKVAFEGNDAVSGATARSRVR